MSKQKNVHEALRKQMVMEIESSYIYQGMRAWFTNNAWDGFSHFMKIQAEEEMGHAEKIYGFLADVGYELSFDAIGAPQAKYDSVEEVFKAALEHEKLVTKNINEIYSQALENKDYASKVFLDWFVNEQVEEEATFTKILDMLAKIGESKHGLVIYDAQLGKRE